MPPLSLANVLAYVCQVALIAAATAASITLARVRNPGARYWSWRVLLWLAVVLPLVQPWEAVTMIVAPAGAEASALLGALRAAPGPDAPSFPLNPLLIIICAGTIGRLVWLAGGAIRLRRIAARAVSDPSDAASLQELIATAADVRYSDDLAQPATCGLRHPVVLLPVRLRELDAATRRAVLAHELVHVKRGDWASLMLEELLRAVLWFNPAVWWLVDRVHAAREEVVDAEAVCYVDGRRSYINALLAFADAPAVATAPAFARRRHLFSRIKRLCEESTMSSRRFLITSTLLTLAIATSTVYAVSAFPIQSGEDVLLAPDAPAIQIAPDSSAASARQPIPPPPPPAPAATNTRPPRDARIPPPPPPPPQAPPAPNVQIQQTPKVIHRVNPTYPVDAMRAGIEGSVEVEITVGADGTVSDARVVRSANPIFDDAAIAAVTQWRFSSPATGPVVRTVELTFSLSRGAAGTPRVKIGSESDALRVGGNIAAPKKTKHVAPDYPPIAKQARVAGMVILEIVVGREGQVVDAVVLRSIPLLDQAAIDAVMQWEFTPTLLNGNPVQTIMTVTVNFTPDGD